MQKAGAMLETIIVKEMLQIQGTPGQIKQVAKGHKKIKASPKHPKVPYGPRKQQNAAHMIIWATKNFVALVQYGPRKGKTRPI